MSIIDAMGIDTQIDVSSDPELLALAIEGDYLGIVAYAATKLATTRQVLIKESIESGDMRCGISKAMKQPSKCITTKY